MRQAELSLLAEAYADAPPEADARDACGGAFYVIPAIWTPAHVLQRMTDAYRVIHYTVTHPGPRSTATAWPAILREWSDLVDETVRERENARMNAFVMADGGCGRRVKIDWESRVDGHTRRMLENESEQKLRRSAERPTSIEIQLADETVSWPMQYLAEDPQLADALSLWAYCRARDVEIDATLRTRKKIADARIDASHAASEARKEAARSEVYREAMAWAREGMATRPLATVSTEALQRARATIGERQLAVSPRPRRHEVYPDKVFSRTTFNRLRWLAGGIVADRLHREGVPVL